MSSFVITGKGMLSKLCCNYYYTLNGITRVHPNSESAMHEFDSD